MGQINSETVSHLVGSDSFATPWTAVPQALPSMGFCRQEQWSGLPFPSPGDVPHPEVKSRSPAPQADSLLSESTREAYIIMLNFT